MTAMKPRAAGTTIAIGLVTLGIWFAWYYFIAFRELDFRAGRRHSGLILLGLVPLAGIVFVLLYMARELRNLDDDCMRLGCLDQRPPAPSLHAAYVAFGLLPSFVVGVALTVQGITLDSPLWFVPLLLAAWSPAVAVPALARSLNAVAAAPAAPRR